MATLLALATASFTGCAVTDGQSTVGQYSDDTAITAQVKTKMAEDPAVSASRISVETLNGTVQLSGFATSQAEKDKAEAMARSVKHVKQVRNSIVVQPKS
jgi:osmotically-inducible protein OsmY